MPWGDDGGFGKQLRADSGQRYRRSDTRTPDPKVERRRRRLGCSRAIGRSFGPCSVRLRCRQRNGTQPVITYTFLWGRKLVDVRAETNRGSSHFARPSKLNSPLFVFHEAYSVCSIEKIGRQPELVRHNPLDPILL